MVEIPVPCPPTFHGWPRSSETPQARVQPRVGRVGASVEGGDADEGEAGGDEGLHPGPGIEREHAGVAWSGGYVEAGEEAWGVLVFLCFGFGVVYVWMCGHV